MDGVGRDIATKKQSVATSRYIDDFRTSRLRLGPKIVNKLLFIMTSHKRAARIETVHDIITACN